MIIRNFFLIMTAVGSLSAIPLHAWAENRPIQEINDSAPTPTLTPDEKLSLARQFVSRISAGFSKADKQLRPVNQDMDTNTAGLPDGEILMFQVMPTRKLVLDILMMGKIKNGRVVLSLRDFIEALEFPIEFDTEAGKASGWYIRPHKAFQLDIATRTVQSDQGAFTLSPQTVLEDGDIFLTSTELGQFFGFKIRPVTSSLNLYVESPILLPVQERLERRERKLPDNRRGPPTLPTRDENHQLIDIPFIDVATQSSIRRDGGSNETVKDYSAAIRTTGDFAYGTLATQARLEKEENLTSLRLNYKRESLEPELLGPLNARRFELGDVTNVRLPIGNSAQEQGVRVTNIHPLRNFIRPSTTITGSAFPGWDVELYRDDQLVGFQTTEDDGTYNFENVELFSADNDFRIVQYGPQGEIQEEALYVPVDTKRLSEMGSAYDISLTRQNTQTYNKQEADDQDKGTPNIRALYEVPVGDTSTLSAGFDTKQRAGELRTILHAGGSTVLAGTLLNLNTAVDNKSEAAAELVARRNIGKHEIRNEIDWTTDRYDMDDNELSSREIFREDLSINGPLPFMFGNDPRYNLGTDYSLSSEDDRVLGFRAGLSTNMKRMSMSQTFNYGLTDFSNGGSQENLDSITTLSGSVAGFRLRLLSDYNIEPENNLDRISLGIQKRLSQNLEAGIGLEKRLEPDLNTADAYLNWNAGFARISPSISYNSDNDFAAMLNTRFGIARDPQQNKIKMFDIPITTSGGLSARVFLDKDGDSVFNNQDEPISGAVISAPQNGGRVTTDENGYAFFKRMRSLHLTDVFIDPSSLADPAWIPGFEGISVIPREGYVETLQFPVHLSGEIDGTVYTRKPDGTKQGLRSATLSLHNIQTGKATSVISESDGFYLFSQVPPGVYYLNVEGDSLKKKDILQPLPQTITIGYEGSTIYGNEIILEEGKKNIPVNIIADSSQITGDPESLEGRTLILNLGSYKSRTLMGLTWFRIRTEFSPLLRQAAILQKPSESYAAVKTGQHTLRVSLPSNDIGTARQICRKISQRDISCGIEIISTPVQKLAAAALPY